MDKVIKQEVFVKDRTLKDKLTKSQVEYLIKLRTSVENDLSARANWDAKIIAAINQRTGVKRYSEYPYNGAPDIPLPETDKLIKKALPNLVLSAWQVKQLCLVNIQEDVQSDEEMYAKAERCSYRMNTHLRSKKVDWFKKLMMAADMYKTYGMAIFKIYEEFTCKSVNKVIDLNEYDEEMVKTLKKMNKSELVMFMAERFNLDPENDTDKDSIEDAIAQLKRGEEVIDFVIEEYENYPNVEICVPSKIIVPSYATEIRTVPRLTYEYFLTRQQLEEKMDKGMFLKQVMRDIESTTSDDDMIETQKAMNEGISEDKAKGEVFRIHETLCYVPTDKKGKFERWVYTSLADEGNVEEALLQTMPYPYEFAGWNYVKANNEIKDPRFYSTRGTPEQIRALQEVLERSMNNMIIRDEMNNMPMWEVKSTSQILSSHIQLRPGMKIPVQALGQEINQLNKQSIPDVSSSMLMQVVKAYTEEYVGSVDQLFRNATNTGGGKTLGEVQQGIQIASGLTMLDVINWNNSISEVYEMMFNIFKERVTDSAYINGVEVSREDFQIPAEVKSNGNLEVVDKEMATQKAFARLQTLVAPPFADIVSPDDKYRATKDWLEKDGVKDPDEFVTDPKEMMQEQSVQMRQQMMQMGEQMQTMSKAQEETKKDVEKNKKSLKDQQATADAVDEMFGEHAKEAIGLETMGGEGGPQQI